GRRCRGQGVTTAFYSMLADLQNPGCGGDDRLDGNLGYAIDCEHGYSSAASSGWRGGPDRPDGTPRRRDRVSVAGRRGQRLPRGAAQFGKVARLAGARPAPHHRGPRQGGLPGAGRLRRGRMTQREEYPMSTPEERQLLDELWSVRPPAAPDKGGGGQQDGQGLRLDDPRIQPNPDIDLDDYFPDRSGDHLTPQEWAELFPPEHGGES